MGCGIDNHIRLEQADRLGHPGRVTEITAIVSGIEIHCGNAAQRGQCALQLPANLTILTKQQDMHQARSP
ncbi:hypothetical protein D3C84_951440 [compost metagenome]